MSKKTYTTENEMLSILTPPNETYNGKQIPVVVSTTEGVFEQSGQSIKNIQFKGTTKTRMAQICPKTASADFQSVPTKTRKKE